MLKKLIAAKLDAIGQDLGYDLSYGKYILDADLRALMRVAKLDGLARYRKGVPLDVHYAVKLVGAMSEDCGPCSQLVVTMAQREGVAADTLRAIITSNDAAMSDELRLGVRFARAVLARDPAADALREEVVARWGKAGLVSLAFALVVSRAYPTLKSALGFARSCQRLTVGGQPVMPHAKAAVTSAMA